jgi:hypothetical protein
LTLFVLGLGPTGIDLFEVDGQGDVFAQSLFGGGKAFLAAFTNATSASNAPTVAIGLHAVSKDGNYSLDATASTKLFNSSK